MKKIHMLTAAAGILLALAGPSLAATRTHRAADAYASAGTADRSGAYYYGPLGYQSRAQAPDRFIDRTPSYTGQNLPYADRPYGDPDGW